MKYRFRESAVVWLKEKGYQEKDIEEMQNVVNSVKLHNRKAGELLLLPKNVSGRVAAMVYLIGSITDPEGRSICFDDKGLIEIPGEARRYYENELELENLEGAVGKLRKAKFGRSHSRPKRRGSVKDERY